MRFFKSLKPVAQIWQTLETRFIVISFQSTGWIANISAKVRHGFSVLNAFFIVPLVRWFPIWFKFHALPKQRWPQTSEIMCVTYIVWKSYIKTFSNVSFQLFFCNYNPRTTKLSKVNFPSWIFCYLVRSCSILCMDFLVVCTDNYLHNLYCSLKQTVGVELDLC